MQLQVLQDKLDREVKLKELDTGAASLLKLEPETDKVVAEISTGNAMATPSKGETSLPAEGRTVLSFGAYLQHNAVYNVDDFGADRSGVADSTPAFLLACAALQGAGGGILRGKGTYKVTAHAGASLFTFTNLNSIEVDFAQALINDVAVYTGTQEAVLFKFAGCSNITINGRVSSQVAVTTNSVTTKPRGLVVARLMQGCRNINVGLDITGCKVGLQPTKLFSDPATHVSRRIRGRITASGCYYPYVAQFSGDDVELSIDTDICGRSFYLYGVQSQRLTVRSKNQQVTSVIWAFNGFGCRDVTLNFIDRDSTSNQAAAPRVQLGWGDSTPATHAGISLTFDVKNPPRSPFAATLEFIKYSDGGTAPDTIGRGHVLDGFTLSGISEQVAGIPHVNQGAGSFASPDLCRNFSVRDFTGIGATSPISFGAGSPISQLSGRAVFAKVTCGHNIYAFNGTNGEVLFMGCKALNFSAAKSETDVHTLIDCNATDGTFQATINKVFINTKIGSVLRNDSLLPGRHFLLASKQLTGDITGAAQNIFKVIPALATGALFRLKYLLVNDQGDFNPAARQAVAGVKSWTAIMDGTGAWAVQTIVTADGTERTLGARPAVLAVSLVNGDATGAFIAVTATNYNNPAGKHQFVLEVVPMTPHTSLIAV
jgi:hypothetical protein